MARRVKNRLPPFVPVFREMLKSRAWEKLGCPARVAYVHLKAKCNGQGGEELTLSYKEMERFMHRHTFSGALRELEEYGFISRTQRGGLYRRRNYFKVIDEWKKI